MGSTREVRLPATIRMKAAIMLIRHWPGAYPRDNLILVLRFTPQIAARRVNAIGFVEIWNRTRSFITKIEAIKHEWLSNPRSDIPAGIVVALALIPEAIGFSIIAGGDPPVGLYASFSIAVIISL